MLPISAVYVAGILLIPLALVSAGIPDRIAYGAMGPSVFAGMIGLFLALDTRPSTGRHLVLLSLAVLAMVGAAQLAAVYVHYLFVAGEQPADGAGFAFHAIRVIASVCAALGTWLLFAYATRAESLWDWPAEDAVRGNAA